MKCPKCDYERQKNEQVPEWQCPSCGIAYSKYNSDSVVTNKSAKAESQLATPTTSRSGSGKTSGFSFKKFRILLLLLVLLVVALNNWLSMARSTDWDHPLWVVVYPINADASAEVADYIPTLTDKSFFTIEDYFVEEAERYGVAIKDPVDVRIGPLVKEMPPLPPMNGGVFDVMIWSLKLRYWSVVKDAYDGPNPDIQVFVMYYKSEENKRLAHSTGLQKGMVSVVHAFADDKLAESNNVVITHEMLHTLGATDKYNLANGQPIYPIGFAEPEREPLFPQQFAEIMGGYIPQSESEIKMPSNLVQTLVGMDTAREIGWLKQ